MIDGDSSDQVEILRAELIKLRQRLERCREAFGECIGQCGEGLVARDLGSEAGAGTWWIA